MPSLQQLADSMQVASPAVGDKKLKLPTIPGAKVTLLGCDYEQLVSARGHIHPHNMVDTPVRVCFTVKRGDEEVTSRDYELTIPAAKPTTNGNAKPQVIPELLQWQGSEGSFSLGTSIYCEPRTRALATTLAADIKALLGKEMTVICSDLIGRPEPGDARIVLRPSPETRMRGEREGYELNIQPNQVIISSFRPEGRYWGTRTLLQMLKQGNGTIPCGTAVDCPRYPVRAFMLDVARLPMPLAAIKDIIRTMSWYKMNELQLHLNDNYIFHEHYVDAGEDPFKRSYAAFRLESDMRGKDGTPLTAQDLFYSKNEFKELVRYAKKHGVSIIPEFDTPGHALSFTRVRPELIYQGPMSKPKRRCEMLDAANPESLRFAAEVWDEYLLSAKGGRQGAVFGKCPVVHVGSDEFFGDKEDYRAYADGILRHVLSRGYTPRIWGSLHAKNGNTPVIAKGVQMNLWSGGWAKAWDSIRQGYDIINTDDGALYIVPFANYYRMDKKHRQIYENWQVNTIHGQRVPAGHPQLLGAMFAIWQDECDKIHNGYMAYDYWPAITESIDVLAERMWGQPTPPRSFDEHRALVRNIGPAPQVNLLHRSEANKKALKLSPAPNSLPHKLECGSLGPNWHLTVELTLHNAPKDEEQVLLSSEEGQLLAVGNNGCIGFRRADTMEFSFVGAKLPVGERVTLELIGKPGNTQLLLNGQPAGTLTLLTHHGRTENLLSTFILPLDTLGQSFRGSIHSLNVSPTE